MEILGIIILRISVQNILSACKMLFDSASIQQNHSFQKSEIKVKHEVNQMKSMLLSIQFEIELNLIQVVFTALLYSLHSCKHF